LDPVRLNQENPRLDGLPVGILATSDKQAENWEPGADEVIFAPSPVAIHGTYNSERIAAQHGSFTAGGKLLKPLNEMTLGPETLRKFVLTEARNKIEAQLSLLGISRSVVYPGLAEMARDIASEEIE
jgi:hypothetical protein